MPQGRRIAAFGREHQDLRTRRKDAPGTLGRSPYRNRRRFCKGKVGVLHTWAMGRTYSEFTTKPFHAEICSMCGKKRYREGLVLDPNPS
jgi:hypothetical protein